MITEPPTFAGLLRWGRNELVSAGINEASADARLLLRHAGGLSASDLILKEPDSVPAAVRLQFEALIGRRCQGAPVSLLIGHVEFMSLRFRTDQRALAPRQDSERLVELALERTTHQPHGVVLDLGTGSGCLILSFLHARPGWRGLALDISVDALSLARENAEANGLFDRVTFIQGSWEDVRDGLGETDLVISNPPYIPSADIRELSDEVRLHDPLLALDGGEDGLSAYRGILKVLNDGVRTGVRVLMEIGYDQGDQLRLLCEQHELTEFAIHKDFSGHNRVVEAVFPEKGLGGIDERR